MRRRQIVLAVGLGLLIVPASAGGYADTRCQGGLPSCARASSDGGRVVFETGDRLVPGDDTNSADVYELVNGKTLRLLTPNPPGEGKRKPLSILKGLSRDGERVVIETQHSYSPQDQDILQDLYVLEDGTWTLVTFSKGFEWFPYLGMSPDARFIYFQPFKRGLVPSDTDDDLDMYEWSREHGVRIVSTGPTERTTPVPPNFTYNGFFGGVSDDGSRVAFTHYDKLTADSPDPNGLPSVFLRDNGSTTTYVPIPGTLPGSWSPSTTIADISPDGNRLYLNTNLQIDPSDTDIAGDVYVRDGTGSFTLISKGPAGNDINGTYVGASRSGDRVFFSSSEQVVPEDTDSSPDIYERFNATTTLVTPRTADEPKPWTLTHAPRFEGVSADGSQVAFSTKSPLVPADKDQRFDIYVRSGGQLHLISTGPADENSKYEPSFADFIDGGNSVIFWSQAPLVETDTDDEVDIYQRILFNPKPKNAVAAGKRKKKTKRAKARGRTKLVSSERIAPRIRLSGRGDVANGFARVRVSCPKKESSGGCKGSVKALGAGGGGFRVKSGRSAWVSVGSAKAVGNTATVVVRGRDLFGNKAKLRKRVSF